MGKIPKIPENIFKEFTIRFRQDRNKAVAWIFAYAYRKGQFDLYKELGIEVKNKIFDEEK